MTLSFQTIRDNGNFVFSSGRPGTYYHQRVELSPREAWNLLQDVVAAQAQDYGLPLHLTPTEFEKVTAFDPARPDETRNERILALFDKVANLKGQAATDRDNQALYCGDQNELGKLLIMQNKPYLILPSIPAPELEKAWNTYRARSAPTQPVP